MSRAVVLALAVVLGMVTAAGAAEPIIIPCTHIDAFLRGEIDVPPGAQYIVTALTRSDVARQAPNLLASPKLAVQQALRDRGMISDEEYAWCQQRVQAELNRRAARAALRDQPGTIAYTPGRPIIATVRLNGRTTARLVLDTGADATMVSPAMLAAAGVDLSQPAVLGKVVGVAGEAKVSYFSVDIEVAGHRARLSEVMAHTQADDNADGLLGRDFLDRFKVTMDPAAGTVTLVPK